MAITINLLGRPSIERPDGVGYQVRSRKSWALLAYLLLAERPPSRSALASLLYPEADDPLRALRWNLAELRRALGDQVGLAGDPVRVELPPRTVVDVHVVTRGAARDALALPGLGAGLLDGFTVRGAPAFETWLLTEQRHVAAAEEAILHEGALGAASRGQLTGAIDLAARAAAMSPLDENHQALLIRLYRRSGDSAAAERQHAACVELFDRELGQPPGPAVQAALRQAQQSVPLAHDPASVEAIIEAGRAAIAAGAAAAGLVSLRAAVGLADAIPSPQLRIRARLSLAEALIHSLGGLEEGLESLHEVDEMARAADDRTSAARARTELGYVDFLRGRYDRAEYWLGEALALADNDESIRTRATVYLGTVASDRAEYPTALHLLREGVEQARACGDHRREAYALSMVGRIGLLRADLDGAAEHLDLAIALAETYQWLAFLPWPQALRAEVALARGELAGAAASAEQAFARACQLGDPCWEGTSARSLALIADARGEPDAAIAGLLDARSRCNRPADTYVWLEASILDALASIGVRQAHPDTRAWIDDLAEVAARAGMRELTVRALLHGAALGDDGAADAAAQVAVGIDNPVLAAPPPRAATAP